MLFEDYPDPEQRLREVAVAAIFVDDAYQRTRNKPLAKRIGAAPSRPMFQTILLSDRQDGSFAVVDGQTRVEGARRAGIYQLAAVVVVGVTRQYEALLFAKLQDERRNISALDRFRSELFGESPRAVQIDAEMAERGLTVGTTKGGFAIQDRVSAIGAIERVWARGGVKLVGSMLDALLEGFPHGGARFHGEVIRGVGRFIAETNPPAWRLALALQSIEGGAEGLLKRAGHLREGVGMGGGSEGYCVDVIEAEYARTRTTPPRVKKAA